MKKIALIILLSLFHLCAIQAQNKIETTLYKSGDEPILELPCVWSLDLGNNRIVKRMFGSTKDRLLMIVNMHPKYSTGDHTVYTFICDDDTGHFSVELSLNYPEKDDGIFVITEKQTLKGNHSISALPINIYSTKPKIVSRYDDMEAAAYRMFIDNVAKEGGDTLKAKEIWNTNRMSK